jgi:type IV pilus assembly protein PilE
VQKSRGFTVVELIIAVAIIGILAAIAIPSYQEHLKKGRRADAQQFLSQVAQKQQQFLIDARAYATTIAELNLTPPTAVANFYDVVLNAPGGTPPTFAVTAAPKAGTAQADDGTLSIDQTGRKIRSVGGTDKDW